MTASLESPKISPVPQTETATERKGNFMQKQSSLVSVLLFVGSALCFFLPFMTVSCGGEKLFTLSGRQLATGTSITLPQPFGPPQVQKIAPDPFAAVAGLCAIVGIGLSLAGRRLAVAQAVSGTVGTISLGVMSTHMQGEIHKSTHGMGIASHEVGFTLTVMLMVTSAAWNIYLLLRERGRGKLPVFSGNGVPAHVEAGTWTSAQR